MRIPQHVLKFLLRLRMCIHQKWKKLADWNSIKENLENLQMLLLISTHNCSSTGWGLFFAFRINHVYKHNCLSHNKVEHIITTMRLTAPVGGKCKMNGGFWYPEYLASQMYGNVLVERKSELRSLHLIFITFPPLWGGLGENQTLPPSFRGRVSIYNPAGMPDWWILTS